MKHSELPLEKSPRILIVRMSAIGDVLMTSPVAQALREHFPGAYIAWAVEPISASLVRANPYVDEVIPVDITGLEKLARKGKFLAALRELRAIRRRLRESRFDIAIDFQGLFKSGIIMKMSGAPRRIGSATPGEKIGFLYTEKAAVPTERTRLSAAYTALLAPLGIDPSPRKLVLEIPEEAKCAARKFLGERGISGVPYAACCVSSTRPQKDWIWERWGELADALCEQSGLRTVFIAGPERKADAPKLTDGRPSRPVSAIGELSLIDSAAVVQGAAVVIGVDTGLTYAGLPADIPTVAMYGSTCYKWLADEPHVIVVAKPMPCAPCFRHPTCPDFTCMQTISVDDITTAVKALLTPATLDNLP